MLVKRSEIKFGIMVPSTPKEAEKFDKDNNNTLWHDAIEKKECHSRVKNCLRMERILHRYLLKSHTILYLTLNMILQERLDLLLAVVDIRMSLRILYTQVLRLEIA